MVWNYNGRALSLMISLAFTALGVAAQTQSVTPAPTVFFTDLQSGPNTGGENNNGTILTIYGKNFGATRGTGTVTVGGGQVAQYYQWGVAVPGDNALQKIAVGLGPGAATGTVVVTTSTGTSACGNPVENCQFTVRTGNIRCVSPTGSDSNNGTLPSSCWATIVNATNNIKPGDIVYIMNGMAVTGVQNFNASIWLGETPGGTAGNPKALVAYPAATATIINNVDAYGIRGSHFHQVNDYWVIAGWSQITSNERAISSNDGVNFWRVVGNNITCPNGTGSSACAEWDSSQHTTFLGNYVHDVGKGDTKLYHGLYFSTDSSHVEIGWNTIARIHGCRGIQFYSSPVGAGSGFNQFDISIHDNIVHDVVCDGINLATIDPSQGAVSVYDNIVYHVGTGPVPPDGGGNYSCLFFGDGTNNGSPGSGTSQVYSNTLYDCGSQGTNGGVGANQLGAVNKGGGVPNLLLNLTNNIIRVVSPEPYVASSGGGGESTITGTNNLWFGNGSAPAQTTTNVNVDPLFVALSGADFHLQATSPAIGAGTSSHASAFDWGGLFRPNPPSIGAYEFSAGAQPVRPNPPTNLTVIVK